MPRWYLWDGGFLLLGRSRGVVPAHAHHAIQLVISQDGVMLVSSAEGEWLSGRGVLVLPDVVHRFDANGAAGAMLFVDPESLEGVWLRTAVARDITIVPEARVESAAEEIRAFLERPFEGMEVGALVRHCVRSLCSVAPPVRRVDERITNVLRKIRESDDLRISAESAAAMVFLSPGRFAHLFKQQVGLPFRRYMLWRKLTRGMLSVGKERTLSAAAHASDFADAAHFTRTFTEMFGITPSALMRGEFFVVPSPFDFEAAIVATAG